MKAHFDWNLKASKWATTKHIPCPYSTLYYRLYILPTVFHMLVKKFVQQKNVLEKRKVLYTKGQWGQRRGRGQAR